MHLYHSGFYHFTAEVKLNNSTFLDRDPLFSLLFENNHNYFNCALLVRLQLLNFK